MLAMSKEYRNELSALWSVSSTGVNFSGINRENRYFVGSLSAGAGGGGARLFADGIDTGGGSNNLMSSNSNVETMERNTPILCLFQRQLPNSGGAGAHRGGVSTEIAVALHKAPKGSISGDVHGSGLEPAQSHGLFGGFPSCNTLFEIYSGTAIREALRNGLPLEPRSLGGKVTRLPPQALFEIDENSIFYIRADGGGGLGDPLLRSPNKVLADVQGGLVTIAQAQKIYGVVFDEGVTTVDERETNQLRQELRAKRLGGNRAAKTIAASIKNEPMIPTVVIHPELQYTLCAACGHQLAPNDVNWKERAVEYSEPLQELNDLMISTRFVLRSFICPDCGTVLDAEMTLSNDPYINIYSRIES
jgi:N-methylhydantoinase B